MYPFKFVPPRKIRTAYRWSSPMERYRYADAARADRACRTLEDLARSHGVMWRLAFDRADMAEFDRYAKLQRKAERALRFRARKIGFPIPSED